MSMKTKNPGKPLVLGVGEVLWDLLPGGKQLGGAPANFAYHAYALGAEALVVSRVGGDPLGGEILSRLQSVALRTDGITNDEELPVVARLFELSGDEPSQMRQLATRFRLRAVALTKGANGSSLLVGNELFSRPGTQLTVVDSVGAGDSYTAALALGLLAGYGPERILEQAHRLADYVCTQPGAMPPLPTRLRET